MIGEFELYHGAAIRELIVKATAPVTIVADDEIGRVNSFSVNGRIGLYLKHSHKRLPPWQFTYLPDHLIELDALIARHEEVWLIHICGLDGMVALTLGEFRAMNPEGCETTCFVRIDRDRNTMYRLNGTAGPLKRSKRRGLQHVLEALAS
jgi:hypothetical protein